MHVSKFQEVVETAIAEESSRAHEESELTLTLKSLETEEEYHLEQDFIWDQGVGEWTNTTNIIFRD